MVQVSSTISQLYGQGSVDRLASSSEGTWLLSLFRKREKSILLVATIFRRLTNPVVNTCARMLAAFQCVTSGLLLAESFANLVHVSSPSDKPAVAIRQPFSVALSVHMDITY